MLLSKSLLNQPVLGLQTGGQLGDTTGVLINPNNLKIEGIHCHDRFSKKPLVILSQDIRDIIPQGIVVDTHEALTDPEELVRLTELLELDFQLLGKTVVTVNRQRLGKVVDFAADSVSLYIQKLYVGQSVFKSLNNGQLSVDRNSVIEITDRKIIIEEIQKPVKAEVATQAA